MWRCIAHEILTNTRNYGLKENKGSVACRLSKRFIPDNKAQWTLEVRGNKPFYQSLDDKHRPAQLDDEHPLTREDLTILLRELAKRCIGERLARAEIQRPGGGFGLAMIHQLCPSLRLDLRCDIDEVGDPQESPLRTILEWDHP
jgi:hypothetical protein